MYSCCYLCFVFGCWLRIANARHGAACFGHHRGMPRRIPDDFDFHVGHAIERQQNVFHAFRDAVVHRATGRRERHRHRQLAVGVGVAINQAEVHDVDAEFRVNDLAQSFENKFVGERCGGHKFFAAADAFGRERFDFWPDKMRKNFAHVDGKNGEAQRQQTAAPANACLI